ncbi:MAG: hypothetical protein IKE30_04490 [Clostridia bacterium]|nr:hypothetical protein [Clostridia bacterium]
MQDYSVWIWVALLSVPLIVALAAVLFSREDRSVSDQLTRIENQLRESREEAAAKEEEAARDRTVREENLRAMSESVRRMAEAAARSQKEQEEILRGELQAGRRAYLDSQEKLRVLLTVSEKGHEEALDGMIETWRREDQAAWDEMRRAVRAGGETAAEALQQPIREIQAALAAQNARPAPLPLREWLDRSVRRQDVAGENPVCLRAGAEAASPLLPVGEWPLSRGKPSAQDLMEAVDALRYEALDPPVTTPFAVLYLPDAAWLGETEANDLVSHHAAKANVILADARAMDALWGALSRIRHGNVWDAVDVRQMLKTGKGDIRRSGEALKKANKRLRQAAEAIAEAEDSARTAMRTYPADTGEEAELLIAARTEEPYGQSDWD